MRAVVFAVSLLLVSMATFTVASLVDEARLVEAVVLGLLTTVGAFLAFMFFERLI